MKLNHETIMNLTFAEDRENIVIVDCAAKQVIGTLIASELIPEMYRTLIVMAPALYQTLELSYSCNQRLIAYETNKSNADQRIISAAESLNDAMMLIFQAVNCGVAETAAMMQLEEKAKKFKKSN